MMRVTFDTEARDEFLEGVDYYEQLDEGLGRRFLDEVVAVSARLAERPALFVAVVRVGARFVVRRALLDSFPYAIVFVQRADEIRVLAVAHQRRLPRYWMYRASRNLDG